MAAQRLTFFQNETQTEMSAGSDFFQLPYSDIWLCLALLGSVLDAQTPPIGSNSCKQTRLVMLDCRRLIDWLSLR